MSEPCQNTQQELHGAKLLLALLRGEYKIGSFWRCELENLSHHVGIFLHVFVAGRAVHGIAIGGDAGRHGNHKLPVR